MALKDHPHRAAVLVETHSVGKYLLSPHWEAAESNVRLGPAFQELMAQWRKQNELSLGAGCLDGRLR